MFAYINNCRRFAYRQLFVHLAEEQSSCCRVLKSLSIRRRQVTASYVRFHAECSLSERTALPSY